MGRFRRNANILQTSCDKRKVEPSSIVTVEPSPPVMATLVFGFDVEVGEATAEVAVVALELLLARRLTLGFYYQEIDEKGSNK
jgi:hypothetical protein